MKTVKIILLASLAILFLQSCTQEPLTDIPHPIIPGSPATTSQASTLILDQLQVIKTFTVEELITPPEPNSRSNIHISST